MVYTQWFRSTRNSPGTAPVLCSNNQNNDAPASLNDYEQQGTIEYYRSQHPTTTDTAVGQTAVFCDYGMMMLWLMAVK
jgi:hypothetical protein